MHAKLAGIMPRAIAVALLCALLSVGRPATSSAESGQRPRVFLAFFGGLQSYSMSDVNRGIDEDNRLLAGSGFTAKKLGSGAAFGAGIRVWPHKDKICLLFDYNHLGASASKAGLAFVTVPIDEGVSAPANALTATLGYFRSWRAGRYGIGGGAGYYICKGDVHANVGAQRRSYVFDGTGLGFHGLAMADIAISRGLHFDAALGYRSAKTGDLKSNGTPLRLDDGSSVRADWSGVVTRFGISIPFDPGPYPSPAGAK